MGGYLWVYTDASRRFATYTNLDPKEYTFHVKGSNNGGRWNETVTSLKVIILPPWWKTYWAYLSYFILFTGLFYALNRYDRKRQRLKHDLELEQVHASKLEEVDRLKSQFFANISHEFRTPLTLILGPAQQMLSGQFTGNFKEPYKLIIRNAKRLLHLINQLLDLSKLDSGKLKLSAIGTEIIAFTNGIVQAFESLAVQEHIRLKFSTDTEAQEVFIDAEKFDTIVINLLSNAFKFTPQGGEVEVRIRKGAAFQAQIFGLSKVLSGNASPHRSGIIEIAIGNTGPGIPPDQIDYIFDRFYQIDGSSQKDEHGTGIGLALVKELVELHHGKILVESNPDHKTTFTVILPLGKAHLTAGEIVKTPSPPSLAHGDSRAGVPSETKPNFVPEPENRESEISILMVEDNTDLRQYIRDNLHNVFSITEAENGEQGLSRARSEIPDLIISDVMMPKMDGFEFCAKIKSDARTSHIPAILITARAAQEDKIEGLETGADDYITKPSDTKELNVRIRNLIEQRQKMREKFIKDSIFEPAEFAVTSIDRKFLRRALDIIEKEIANPEFDVQAFVKQMAISRTLLYNKLKVLAGQSVREFIRTIRLKRSAQLIRDQAGSISEIAYHVGFKSPAYFSECFHKQFGQPPLFSYLKSLKVDVPGRNMYVAGRYNPF